MSKNYQTIAAAILEQVGGAANITTVENCMTRLCLTLHNDAAADKTALGKIADVLGVLEANNQLHIILGPGTVNHVKDALLLLLETAAASPVFGDGKALHASIRKKMPRLLSCY